MRTTTLTIDKRLRSTVLLLAAVFWCVALLAHPLFHLATHSDDGDTCYVCLAFHAVHAAPAPVQPAGAMASGERATSAAPCATSDLLPSSLSSRAPPELVG